MYACPLCNGLKTIEKECPSCQQLMEDKGRLVDYMGDYIAYLEYDGTNLIDGDPDSTHNHECIHLFYCSNCSVESQVSVDEVRR